MEESSNTQRTPYLFTGKELDEQTSLYYFGARYYDPRTSVWQSPNPILKEYMRGEPAGGITQPVNLNLYGYVAQKPIMQVDPTGEWRVNYRQNVINWRQAERLEVRRLRRLGHEIIRGRGVDERRVSASYEEDLYIRGREYDIISVDPEGLIHLTEVKFRRNADPNRSGNQGRDSVRHSRKWVLTLLYL